MLYWAFIESVFLLDYAMKGAVNWGWLARVIKFC